MRANPHLLRGANQLWIRFFLLAVYATMYVRDHQRPYMHEAFGIDPTDYDYKVFSITSAMLQAGVPVHARHRQPALPRTCSSGCACRWRRSRPRKKRGGLIGTLQRGAAAIGVASLFVRLYFQPVIEHELPRERAHGAGLVADRMEEFALPLLFALAIWWSATAVVMFLDGLPRTTFRWTLLGATVLQLVALYGIWETRDDSSVDGGLCRVRLRRDHLGLAGSRSS